MDEQKQETSLDDIRALLESHIDETRDNFKNGDERMSQIETRIGNLESGIQTNTDKIVEVDKSTKGLVHAWTVSTGFLEVVKFTAKFVVPIAIGLVAAWHFIKELIHSAGHWFR